MTHRTFAEVWNYYKGLRFGNLTSPEYRHILWLIFWPAFGALFYSLERLIPMTFHPVACGLDAYIPFCEYFVIPYYYWFAFMIGMLAYTLLFNIPAFVNYMKFVLITYAITIAFYIIYPTMQELRPTVFPRDNLCTDIVQLLYAFDTNTNVCPSIHILGAVAACLGGWQCRTMATTGWRIFLIVSTVLICASTVFLKQHSIIDVIAALAVCAVAYPFVYTADKKKHSQTA